MRKFSAAAMVIGILASLGLTASAADVEDGFVSLFNGRDLAGWVITNDEFVEKVRNKDEQWNTTCTAAYGDRLVQTLNGFCTSDIVDEACEKTGKLGLQMHGGTDCEMFFKDFEVMPITADMMKLIDRK